MQPKPWYDKGLRFQCTACGNCCRNHGDYAYVYLTEGEIRSIAGHLGLDRPTFLERYCQDDRGWTTLRMDAPACPFLGDDNLCRIYPVRPKQCATWPFWKENLDRAVWEGPVRDCCPGIGKGPLHSREEVERIAEETEAWYEQG